MKKKKPAKDEPVEDLPPAMTLEEFVQTDFFKWINDPARIAAINAKPRKKRKERS